MDQGKFKLHDMRGACSPPYPQCMSAGCRSGRDGALVGEDAPDRRLTVGNHSVPEGPPPPGSS